MTIKFTITQNGIPLDKRLYTWDEVTKTFSTKGSHLLVNFSGYSGITFNTGGDCTFDTGDSCVFKTGSSCTFKTGSYCVFKTGRNCTFDIGSNCTLYTGSDCTFRTGNSCTFDVLGSCTFTTGEKCVMVRRDVYEIIELPEGIKIVLNGDRIKGIKNKGEVMEQLL